MYLFRIDVKFKDLSNFDDYFKFSKFMIAIIDTRLADKLLSLMIIFTN